MLTKGLVTRLELPHEVGSWVDITPLGYRALRRAREVRTLEQVRLFSSVQSLSTNGLQTAVAEAVQQAPPTPEQVEIDTRRKRADLNEYDVPTLLQEGIVSWSYDEKVSPAALDTLDEETAEYVARALIPQPETAEERKNV